MSLPPTPWSRPNPLPEPVCETERLICRFYVPADAEALYDATLASRDALLPWLPWAADPHPNVAAARELIHDFTRRSTLADADDFVLGLFDRATGALVGGTGFHRIDAAVRCAEIGYWIAGDRQRQGLCTEAIRALVTAGFGPWGFRRIKMCCAAPNVGSVGVIRRLGLRLEAREVQARYVEGYGLVDSLTFAVLDTEWDATAGRGPGGNA